MAAATAKVARQVDPVFREWTVTQIVQHLLSYRCASEHKRNCTGQGVGFRRVSRLNGWERNLLRLHARPRL